MLDWKIYEHEPTPQLIKLIQRRKEPSFENNAQAAYEAFTFRYTQQLTQKNEIVCKNWGYSDVDAIEVTQRTFIQFWKYPKFDPAKTNTANIDDAVILYLLGISRNVLSDYVNQLNGIKCSPYNGNETIVWDFPVNQNTHAQEVIKDQNTHFEVVRRALAKLSEKHKVIFLTYKAYEHGTNKLPRKLLAEIREKLNISQTTVRAYKFEAYKKVNEYLEIYGLKKF
jgi:RNA polymerase sigma factor (sigma-70 family)